MTIKRITDLMTIDIEKQNSALIEKNYVYGEVVKVLKNIPPSVFAEIRKLTHDQIILIRALNTDQAINFLDDCSHWRGEQEQ